MVPNIPYFMSSSVSFRAAPDTGVDVGHQSPCMFAAGTVRMAGVLRGGLMMCAVMAECQCGKICAPSLPQAIFTVSEELQGLYSCRAFRQGIAKFQIRDCFVGILGFIGLSFGRYTFGRLQCAEKSVLLFRQLLIRTTGCSRI